MAKQTAFTTNNTQTTLKKRGQASEIDKLVGQRLKTKRKELGLSQSDVSDKIDITFQQLQKYESGANRISAGKLFELSALLKTPMSFFFADLLKTNQYLVSDNNQVGFDSTNLYQDAELVKLFQTIKDKAVREEILQFVRKKASK